MIVCGTFNPAVHREKKNPLLPGAYPERATRFELATLTLAMTIAALLLTTAGLGTGRAAAQAANVGGSEANVVIALVDTGINPYHKVFRDNSPHAYGRRVSFPIGGQSQIPWRSSVGRPSRRVVSEVRDGELVVVAVRPASDD